MDSTSEAQQTAAERLAEQQLGELVAFAAGQLDEPAVEHAEAQGAPPPVAAGANGIWGGETTPSLPSVDSELDNHVSRALGIVRLIWIVLCCAVLLSPVQSSPVQSGQYLHLYLRVAHAFTYGGGGHPGPAIYCTPGPTRG